MPTVSITDYTVDYWTTLRTLTTQASESTPASGLFVSTDSSAGVPEEVEIRFNALTTANSPTNVIFKVWRFIGGRVDRVANITYETTDYATPIPAVVRFDGSKIWITVEFIGGSSPTVSTLVEYRVVK